MKFIKISLSPELMSNKLMTLVSESYNNRVYKNQHEKVYEQYDVIIELVQIYWGSEIFALC